jgi:hypothetical protein
VTIDGIEYVNSATGRLIGNNDVYKRGARFHWRCTVPECAATSRAAGIEVLRDTLSAAVSHLRSQHYDVYESNAVRTDGTLARDAPREAEQLATRRNAAHALLAAARSAVPAEVQRDVDARAAAARHVRCRVFTRDVV